jgi:hypothetical protein
MITIIGIFEDVELAEEAVSYLLANEFKSEDIDIYTSGENTHETDRVSSFFSHLFSDEKEVSAHTLAGLNGTIVTVHAMAVREAQEAVDVLNNYGALDVNAADETPDSENLRSRIIELYIEEHLRLRD